MTTFAQKGQTFTNLTYTSDTRNMALSGDGNLLVIGYPNEEDGVVKTWEWFPNRHRWIMKETAVLVETETSSFGISVSMSSDGTRLAVGCLSDKVFMYQWNNTEAEWELLEEIVGPVGSGFGFNLRIASSGKAVMVFANNATFLAVFKWDGLSWTPLGSYLYGNSANKFGAHFAIVSETVTDDVNGGTREVDHIAISEPLVDFVRRYDYGFGMNYTSYDDDAGRVRVWTWTGSQWSQTGVYEGFGYDEYGRGMDLMYDSEGDRWYVAWYGLFSPILFANSSNTYPFNNLSLPENYPIRDLKWSSDDPTQWISNSPTVVFRVQRPTNGFIAVYRHNGNWVSVGNTLPTSGEGFIEISKTAETIASFDSSNTLQVYEYGYIPPDYVVSSDIQVFENNVLVLTIGTGGFSTLEGVLTFYNTHTLGVSRFFQDPNDANVLVLSVFDVSTSTLVSFNTDEFFNLFGFSSVVFGDNRSVQLSANPNSFDSLETTSNSFVSTLSTTPSNSVELFSEQLLVFPVVLDTSSPIDLISFSPLINIVSMLGYTGLEVDEQVIRVSSNSVLSVANTTLLIQYTLADNVYTKSFSLQVFDPIVQTVFHIPPVVSSTIVIASLDIRIDSVRVVSEPFYVTDNTLQLPPSSSSTSFSTLVEYTWNDIPYSETIQVDVVQTLTRVLSQVSNVFDTPIVLFSVNPLLSQVHVDNLFVEVDTHTIRLLVPSSSLEIGSLNFTVSYTLDDIPYSESKDVEVLDTLTQSVFQVSDVLDTTIDIAILDVATKHIQVDHPSFEVYQHKVRLRSPVSVGTLSTMVSYTLEGIVYTELVQVEVVDVLTFSVVHVSDVLDSPLVIASLHSHLINSIVDSDSFDIVDNTLRLVAISSVGRLSTILSYTLDGISYSESVFVDILDVLLQSVFQVSDVLDTTIDIATLHPLTTQQSVDTSFFTIQSDTLRLLTPITPLSLGTLSVALSYTLDNIFYTEVVHVQVVDAFTQTVFRVTTALVPTTSLATLLTSLDDASTNSSIFGVNENALQRRTMDDMALGTSIFTLSYMLDGVTYSETVDIHVLNALTQTLFRVTTKLNATVRIATIDAELEQESVDSPAFNLSTNILRLLAPATPLNVGTLSTTLSYTLENVIYTETINVDVLDVLTQSVTRVSSFLDTLTPIASFPPFLEDVSVNNPLFEVAEGTIRLPPPATPFPYGPMTTTVTYTLESIMYTETIEVLVLDMLTQSIFRVSNVLDATLDIATLNPDLTQVSVDNLLFTVQNDTLQLLAPTIPLPLGTLSLALTATLEGVEYTEHYQVEVLDILSPSVARVSTALTPSTVLATLHPVAENASTDSLVFGVSGTTLRRRADNEEPLSVGDYTVTVMYALDGVVYSELVAIEVLEAITQSLFEVTTRLDTAEAVPVATLHPNISPVATLSPANVYEIDGNTLHIISGTHMSIGNADTNVSYTLEGIAYTERVRVRVSAYKYTANLVSPTYTYQGTTNLEEEIGRFTLTLPIPNPVITRLIHDVAVVRGAGNEGVLLFHVLRNDTLKQNVLTNQTVQASSQQIIESANAPTSTRQFGQTESALDLMVVGNEYFFYMFTLSNTTIDSNEQSITLEYYETDELSIELSFDAYEQLLQLTAQLSEEAYLNESQLEDTLSVEEYEAQSTELYLQLVEAGLIGTYEETLDDTLVMYRLSNLSDSTTLCDDVEINPPFSTTSRGFSDAPEFHSLRNGFGYLRLNRELQVSSMVVQSLMLSRPRLDIGSIRLEAENGNTLVVYGDVKPLRAILLPNLGATLPIAFDGATTSGLRYANNAIEFVYNNNNKIRIHDNVEIQNGMLLVDQNIRFASSTGTGLRLNTSLDFLFNNQPYLQFHADRIQVDGVPFLLDNTLNVPALAFQNDPTTGMKVNTDEIQFVYQNQPRLTIREEAVQVENVHLAVQPDKGIQFGEDAFDMVYTDSDATLRVRHQETPLIEMTSDALHFHQPLTIPNTGTTASDPAIAFLSDPGTGLKYDSTTETLHFLHANQPMMDVSPILATVYSPLSIGDKLELGDGTVLAYDPLQQETLLALNKKPILSISETKVSIGRTTNLTNPPTDYLLQEMFKTWTYGTVSGVTDTDVYHLAWGEEVGVVCAVGGTETESWFLSSADGETWASYDLLTESRVWRRVCWGYNTDTSSGVFCAITDDAIVTSSDGTNWTIQPVPVPSTLVDIAWSPTLNLFCIVTSTQVGTLSSILYSSDGVTWSMGGDTLNLPYSRIVWDAVGERFVAFSPVAWTGGEQILFSAVNDVTQPWTASALPQEVISSDTFMCVNPDTAENAVLVLESFADYANAFFLGTTGWRKVVVTRGGFIDVLYSTQAQTYLASTLSGEILFSRDGAVWDTLFIFPDGVYAYRLTYAEADKIACALLRGHPDYLFVVNTFTLTGNEQHVALEVGQYGSTTADPSLLFQSSSNSGFRYVNNNVVLKVHSAEFTFQSNGTAVANTWQPTSDVRLKHDIRPLDEPDILERIRQLEPVTYERKTGEEGVRHAGFLADHVQTLFPDAVREHRDVIPSIRQWVRVDGNCLVFPEPVENVRVGDTLRLHAPHAESRVVRVEENRVWLETDVATEQVWVEGHVVDDVKSLDPMAILAYQVHALQRLHAQLDALERRL